MRGLPTNSWRTLISLCLADSAKWQLQSCHMATLTKRPTARAKEKRGAAKRVPRFSQVPSVRTSQKTGRGSYERLMGLEAASTLDLVEQVKRGLSFSAVERLRQRMGVSTKTMAELLQIKLRTLLRRKEEGRLHPDESDRVVRASRLLGRALDLFDGNEEAAKRWLLAPQRALGGAVPLEVARTEVGAREVEHIIGRLEHGVFT